MNPVNTTIYWVKPVWSERFPDWPWTLLANDMPEGVDKFPPFFMPIV